MRVAIHGQLLVCTLGVTTPELLSLNCMVGVHTSRGIIVLSCFLPATLDSPSLSLSSSLQSQPWH